MKASKAQQTLQTKANVLQAGLALFNRYCTTQVHTHDIAKKAGISPGNLYYHYKDKEEIIRDLFLKIDLYDEKNWEQTLLSGVQYSFSDFMDFFFASQEKYRFFFCEFPILLQKDPKLAVLWRKRYTVLFEVMKKTALGWVKNGIMKPFESEEDVCAFIDMIWIVMNYSFTYLEAKHALSPRAANDKGIKLVARFLLPYHTAKGKKEVQRYLEK